VRKRSRRTNKSSTATSSIEEVISSLDVRKKEEMDRINASVFGPPDKTIWKNPWRYCRDSWAFARLRLDLDNLDVPAWYCAYAGVPQWYLRQRIHRNKKMYTKRCQLAMLVRMRYVLDTGVGLPAPVRKQYLSSSRRLLPLWGRSNRPPVYAGGTFPITGGCGCNKTFALAPGYDLVGTLVRTSRNIVHLCHRVVGWSAP